MLVCLTGGRHRDRDHYLERVTLREAMPYLKRQIEIRTTDACIRGFAGVVLPFEEPPKDKRKIKMVQVEIGHACGGTEIDKCRAYYEGHAGPGALQHACRMCHGPGKK